MSGANKSLYDWISEDEDDEFTIVLPHANPNQDFARLKNCKVISGNYFCIHRDLASKPVAYRVIKHIKIIYMFLLGKIFLKVLEKKIAKMDIDAIISNSFSVIYGAIVAKKVNLPHFWHIREFMESDHQIAHKNQELVNELASYSNAIFISDVVADYYRNKYNFKNGIVIYDQIKIDQDFDVHKEFFEDDVIRIMMSGTLQENKRQKEAIKAVSLLLKKGMDIRLDIYGDGPQRKELRSLVRDTDPYGNIVLKGYCKNLESVRKNYDIALVCSSNEALGRVTVESMGSGCITVGADAGCTSKIIEDGVTGYLYRLHDVEDLKRKIEYIFEHRECLNEIRRNAREYACENFSKPIHGKIISYIDSCNT